MGQFKIIFERVIKVDEYINKLKKLLLTNEKKLMDLNDEKFVSKLNSLFFTNNFKIKISISHFFQNAFSRGITTDKFIQRAYYEHGSINIFFYDDFYNFFSKYKYKFKKFVEILLDTIEHEQIHNVQYKGKDPHTIVNPYDDIIKYLKNPQEMMAISKQIINELLRKQSKEDILIKLKYYPGNLQYDSDLYRMYYEKFHKKDKKIWNRLMKYIYQYLTS